MKNYTIRPDKTAENWILKLEDVAPEEEYENMNDAIEAGKKLAADNMPSRLTIYNHLNEIVDDLKFKE